MIFLQLVSHLYFEAIEQTQDFISKSLKFRVQNFAKFEGGFYVESDFQKTHQVAFRTTISIQNLHSFYRAKTDLKFALIFWGKDSWKENDGWIYDGIFVPTQYRLIFENWLWKGWFWSGLHSFFLIWASTEWKKANLQSQELVFVADEKNAQVSWNRALKKNFMSSVGSTFSRGDG